MRIAPLPVLEDREALAARRLERFPFGAMVANLREVYAAAPPAELAAGLSWYDAAHELARNVAKLAGAELENAAACIAALSPRLDWEPNARAALELARGENPRGVLRASVRKARAVLRGDARRLMLENPARGRGGFKTAAFFECILRPSSAPPVCIDSHAIAAALGRAATDAEARVLFGRRRIYEKLARAYQAARPAGIPTHVFQAVVWCAWRALPRAERIPF